MQDEQFNITSAAEFLKVPVTTLKFWRASGTGPSFLKLGKRIIYLKSDLVEFWESRRMKQSNRIKAA